METVLFVIIGVLLIALIVVLVRNHNLKKNVALLGESTRDLGTKLGQELSESKEE